ncbi:GIY-YIg endonuclease [Fadolivirus algeromassiliense]|jgi:hypothetical protein|uniref:GIY-YIg endonuclease n=1 Tax=Fadolivirus FV1/VV64 TaxID=3070911 RepID=A0A7D3R0Q0_9VIRU|nr:GIY-YIg endonuclease [Fadolivirus algeromassiliense]QKF93902.1 GIY-YIg endonuclease [Fadolivirus FV1/VV64]
MEKTETGTKYIDINSGNQPNDINMGEIYIATSKTSGKSYIGQAKCYINCEGNIKIWGTKNRWRSHIYESRSSYDHSTVLNSAIRKYGENDFYVRTLVKCDLDKLNYWEIEYIQAFDTLLPHGYNIMKGGSHRSVSEEAKERLQQYRLGRQHKEMTKLYMSISQLKISSDLPRYLYKKRRNNKIIYYVRYPIIENNEMDFIIKNVQSIDIGKKMILELEQKYDTTNQINKIKAERALTNKKKKDKIELPEYITPIYDGIYKIGYRVSNYIYSDGTNADNKDFTNANTNTRNLHNAKVYLASIERINANLSFQIPKLPNGFLYFTEKNRVDTKIEGFKIRTGYKVNKNPNPKSKKKVPIYKKFCDMNMSLQEKYNAANNFYNTLENTQI